MLFRSDNYDVGFLTDNAERMTILAGGYVGITTTTPACKLDVRDTTAGGASTPVASFTQLQATNGYGSTVKIRNNDTSVYAVTCIGFQNAAGDQIVQIGSAGSTYDNGAYYPAISPNGSFFYTTGKFGMVSDSASGQFAFQVGNAGGTAAIKMLIDSSGKVGIGTVSPASRLHLVAGSSAANTAPLQFTAGSLETTPRSGTIEFDGTNLYWTNSSNSRSVLGSSVNTYRTLFRWKLNGDATDSSAFMNDGLMIGTVSYVSGQADRKSVV